jgi:glutamate dehydrogenase (NAD(P)+)
MAQQQFDGVAEKLGLDEATRELLRNPLREYHFSIPVKWTMICQDFSRFSSAA